MQRIAGSDPFTAHLIAHNWPPLFSNAAKRVSIITSLLSRQLNKGRSSEKGR